MAMSSKCPWFFQEKMPWEGRSRDRGENPSFSSTLLDAIYRSIDEPNSGKTDEELIFYGETMRKKVSSEKVVPVRRKSMADFDSRMLKSSSSSSDSSSGGGFSSSESDSFYGPKSRSSSYTEGYKAQRPKPIRTTVSGWNERYGQPQLERQKAKREGGFNFISTKSKALKIYSDLKKVKQPISPGRRLASFLNSLFTTGNMKKAKISSSGYQERKTPSSSTCSSASSFSRSCLSKTPSSRGNGTKRSVSFYPFSVIVDEDCRPCGHKNLNETEQSTTLNPRNRDLESRIMEENRRVVEAAKHLLKNYQKRKDEFNMRDLSNNVNEEVSSDEEDDAASYASSDLFELDNLSVIGVERYREELPVYETTHLDTNRAIATGLVM